MGLDPPDSGVKAWAWPPPEHAEMAWAWPLLGAGHEIGPGLLLEIEERSEILPPH